jgi:hypothetical protein
MKIYRYSIKYSLIINLFSSLETNNHATLTLLNVIDY